jgi:hypothetical protein
MGTERIPALTALHDSVKPWRLEADKLLHLAINHKAATPFLGVARLDPRIYKAAAGDSRSIEFRVGEPSIHDTSDSSVLGFAIKHNASGELEVFADNSGSPKGLKIASNGNITVTGNTTFTGSVTGAIPVTILTGSATIDPPSMVSGAHYVTTVTVTGLVLANAPVVWAGCSISLNAVTVQINAQATANNTVTVDYWNYGGSSVNPVSHTCKVIVFQF